MEMESRRITLEEMVKRMEKPIKYTTFELDMDRDDLMYEDSTTLTISLSRLIWKVLYAASKGTGDSVSCVASELITDGAYAQFDLAECVENWVMGAK